MCIGKKLQTNFGEIQENANGVAQLVTQISISSGEQSRGIDQLKIAIESIDSSTQSSAQSAEESAGISQELHHQADTLNSMIGQLIALVSGGGENGNVAPVANSQVAFAEGVTTQQDRATTMIGDSETRQLPDRRA